MAGVQMGFEEGLAKTPFLAAVDEAYCDYCGECLKTCLGCGACIPVCEEGAISLVPRTHHRRPPKNEGRMFARILWERRRIGPFISERIRRTLRRVRR